MSQAKDEKNVVTPELAAVEGLPAEEALNDAELSQATGGVCTLTGCSFDFSGIQTE
jgi:hypothetical protein